MNETAALQIGWASADITPDEPVEIAGQFYARVSEGVLDPVTVTALALSAGDGRDGRAAVMVSCDLVGISSSLLKAVRAIVGRDAGDLDPQCVILFATHTHTAPEIRSGGDDTGFGGGISSTGMGVKLPAMDPAEYVAFVARRIAEAVGTAWQGRAPGSIGFGLGHAVVGHNRRIAYFDGHSQMYGRSDQPDFNHVEGYEDHAVNVLATWSAGGELTGVAVNLACTSQVSEHLFQISADFWHETRVELRRRWGEGLFVLPQCSAAGDQSPHVQVGKAAEERMWRLTGRTQRQDIAVRIADAVASSLPAMERDRSEAPAFAHRVETIELPWAAVSDADCREALAKADKLRARYEALRRELSQQPQQSRPPRWYVPITRCYRRMKWCEGVRERLERARVQPRVPVEVHVLRIGEAAVATNPFECYLDYGVRIKARSPAVQTFVVQLAGGGTYLPTARALAGRSYGAIPASSPVGPEGGRELVERTLEAIQALWPRQDRDPAGPCPPEKRDPRLCV